MVIFPLRMDVWLYLHMSDHGFSLIIVCCDWQDSRKRHPLFCVLKLEMTYNFLLAPIFFLSSLCCGRGNSCCQNVIRQKQLSAPKGGQMPDWHIKELVDLSLSVLEGT